LQDVIQPKEVVRGFDPDTSFAVSSLPNFYQ